MRRQTRKRRAVKRAKSTNRSTAIVSARPQAVQGVRPQKLSQDQRDLLTRTICKGASPDELALFLMVCEKHQVDPFSGEIYAIMRWDNKRDVIGQQPDGRPIY